MGGLCKEGHQFLKICKKKDPAATLRMVDVLVTQHSKWTARRVRRSLFGQAIVDFTADPWVALKDDNDHKTASVQKRTKKKFSRLEKGFSQAESQSSQATTVVQDTPIEPYSSQATTVIQDSPTEPCSYSQDIPNGTVYFSDDSCFQDFSGFQKQSFQQSFQHSHFLNESYTQEHTFSERFQEPAPQQNLL